MPYRHGSGLGKRAAVASHRRRVCRDKGCRVGTAVCVDVLHRFVGIVLMKRAVIVVMMRLFFKVQYDVRNAVAVIVF